ncbi:MAG: large conductance mechanosensitive channel protein MscL [Erysipelotrichaceae bacterium]|nr:large conductance mechanosensitive channel protein MscL [Erysipelotrichaceae bacterium]
MKKFFKEFKDFINRGNILDMAVGVIIGGAFGKIVSSLTNDIIMPLIGAVVGNDVTDWKWVFKQATYDEVTGVIETAEGALRYGNFIQAIIDFLIIALVLFIIIKLAMAAAKKREELKAKAAARRASGKPLTEEEQQEVEELPAPSEEVLLLTEIRDLLNKENKPDDK